MILALAVAYVSSFAASDTAFQTPAMGWNSYDCYGTMVREQEVKDNAAYMANKLKALGWKYIVIDACWSKPDNSLGTPAWQSQHPSWIANMDQYGRLIPDALRFPSSNG